MFEFISEMLQQNENDGLVQNSDKPRCIQRKAKILILVASVVGAIVVIAVATTAYAFARPNRTGLTESLMENKEGDGSSTKPVAVAFEGGGFLAHSVYTGFIEGLNQLASDSGNTEATLAATNILGRFDVISTVSGGSWFMSELAFSNYFLSMVQSASSDPGTAGAMYNQHWIAPFLQTGSQTNGFIKAFADLIKALGGTFLAQDLKELSYFWSTGLTWSGFVETLLQTTGQIDKTTPLGGDVNDWSKGKIWIAGHSLVTPGGSCSYCDKSATFWQQDGGLDFAEYKLGSATNQPLFTPARFSIELGSGEGATAPVSYCAPGMCDLSVLYKGANWAGVDRFTAPGSLNIDGAEQYAGTLPLVKVVAASSAFLGAASTSDATDVVQDMVSSQFAVWTTSPTNGASFSDAESTISSLTNAGEVTSTTLKALSKKGIHSIIDGGYTDNTGIAHAIAAGADEVVTFLVDVPDFFNLFQGGPSEDDVVAGIYEIYFQIFQESSEQVQTLVNNFDTLAVGSAQHLQSVQIGTITATTVQSDEFGIAAGRTVTLHVVAVDSLLSIGGLDDFTDYGVLVQEIVTAVTSPANKELGTQLLGFMQGS